MSTAGRGQGGSPGRRSWRTVDGLVLLDKPVGMSSNHALQRVRRLLQAAKGGHAGTLDPMATGMLPLAFGQGTKACGALLGATKAYRARLRLGTETDTGDAEGSVIREGPVPHCDARRIEDVLATFVGVSEQRPPMYSALKRDGRPLYELARAGIEVERAPRRIEIHRLGLLSAEAGSIDIEVECSKGTYVRVLGADVAAALGTCGHLEALRRLWVEPFEPWPMVTMETIERWAGEGDPPVGPPDWLLPVDTAFCGRPRVDLDELEALHLGQGRVLTAPAGCAPGHGVRAYGPDGVFLGLVEATPAGTLRVERLFVDGASAAGTAGSP